MPRPNITKIKYGAPPKAVARELRRKCVEVKVQWCVQVVKPVTRALTLGRTSGGGMSHPYEVLFSVFIDDQTSETCRAHFGTSLMKNSYYLLQFFPHFHP